MSDSPSRWGERLVFATAKPVVVPANPHAVAMHEYGITDIDGCWNGAPHDDARTARRAEEVIEVMDIAL